MSMRFASTYLILVLIGLSSGCATPTTQAPQLHFEASVAADFRHLATDTWEQFLATFATRTKCFGDVTLGTDPNLKGRAMYDPATSTVIVRVPGTPALLQAALVHEWAHHIEFQCADHYALRPEILASLQLPADTQWRVGHEWEDTPSEQYAEAVVELVLGEHPLPTKIWVNRNVVDILERWSKENAVIR